MNVEGVHLDLSIRLGDILVVLGFLGTVTLGYFTIKSDIKLFGWRLDVIDASVEGLQRELGSGKVQDEKINRLEEDTSTLRKQVFELQRGQGYVQQSLNGEWSRQGKVSGG